MGPDRSQPDARGPGQQEKAAGNGERRGAGLFKQVHGQELLAT